VHGAENGIVFRRVVYGITFFALAVRVVMLPGVFVRVIEVITRDALLEVGRVDFTMKQDRVTPFFYDLETFIAIIFHCRRVEQEIRAPASRRHDDLDSADVVAPVPDASGTALVLGQLVYFRFLDFLVTMRAYVHDNLFPPFFLILENQATIRNFRQGALYVDRRCRPRCAS
jgi:hypothetical protein